MHDSSIIIRGVLKELIIVMFGVAMCRMHVVARCIIYSCMRLLGVTCSCSTVTRRNMHSFNTVARHKV